MNTIYTSTARARVLEQRYRDLLTILDFLLTRTGARRNG